MATARAGATAILACWLRLGLARLELRTVAALALAFVAPGSLLSAHAQVDANRFCRDRTPDGYYDCAWLPSRLGLTTYLIPGPIQAVQSQSEDEVIANYKGVIASNAGSGLCSSITRELGGYSNTIAEDNWSLAGFWQRQAAPIAFTYSIWEGTGPSRECKPRTIGTQLYKYRDVGCASGWASSYDSGKPSNRLCYRQPSGSLCPVGNPITLFEQSKQQYATDLPPASARSIEFRRVYSSVGPYGIGVREGFFAWEDFGIHWRHNFSGRVEAIGTGTQVAVSRGAKTTYFGVGSVLPDGRFEYLPFGRDQRDRLLVERDANGWFVRASYFSTDNIVEEYQVGRLARITRKDGYWQQLTYKQFVYSNGDPGDLKIESVMDALGRRITFQYSNDTEFQPIEGLLTRVTDVDGVSVNYNYQFVYDPPAIGTNMHVVNLVSATQRDGTVVRYVYGEVSSFPAGGYPVRQTHLTGMEDELGTRTGIYKYNGSGQAVSSESAGGINKYQVTSNSFIDPLGTTYSAQVTLAAGLNRVAGWYQPAGAGCGATWSSISYDMNANVSSASDFNGKATCFAHDLARNLETKRVEGVSSIYGCPSALSNPPTGSRVISTQWHPDWRLETKIAEPNRITTITYNGQGATCAPSTMLVDGKPPAVVCSRSEQATTDATGGLGFAAGLSGTARTWSYTYTTYGRVLTATDPNGKVTTTSYYLDDDPDMGRRGNVATVTNAAGHVTRITAYNLHGQPTQIVDPNGLVTDLTYDLRLRLTSRKVGSELTTFAYDPRGLLTTVALPDGAGVAYSYDAAHRLIAVADQQGNRIDYTLDAMGNRIAEKASDSGGTLVRNIQRTIDALNRVQQITGAQ